MPRILRRHSREEHKKIKSYVKIQRQEDITSDQISLKAYIDPFTGEKVRK